MPRTSPTYNFSCLFFLIHLVDSKKCISSFCGNKNVLTIHYPFQLQNQQHQKGCDHPPIDLTCSNNQTTPIINLPSSRDFYVRNINYSSQTIQLYDPNNCLPSRFMNSNFSPYPLSALNYQNYSFFSCPNGLNSRSDFTAISCLSNSTHSIQATSSISRAQEIGNLNCTLIQTVPVPVSSSLQYEYNGFNDDLLLTWDIPRCDVCDGKPRRSVGHAVLVIVLSLVIPNVAFAIIWIMFLLIVKLVKALKGIYSRSRRHFSSRTRTSAIELRVRRGHDDAVITLPRSIEAARNNNNNNNSISATRTVVLGESMRIPEPNGTLCPICLEDFKEKEIIRCINECGHCFHTDCIDQWLSTHNSCPICRSETQ